MDKNVRKHRDDKVRKIAKDHPGKVKLIQALVKTFKLKPDADEELKDYIKKMKKLTNCVPLNLER